ncbi:MAG TPA: type IV secretion system DNA-binding domain-containing protein [bacterium]|nr:type IV secretion system DNA-binding domain-containing protein [bacterium]
MPNHSDNEITYFAKTNFRNQDKKFGIKLDDRRRHMYVLGKTGVGKTTLLKNMIIQDIENGHGLAYLDPHGDDVQEVLECIPTHRINDVVYFNPADLEYPIAFNILENVEPEYNHLVSDGLMGVFTKIWANMWSARMEHILRNCILALLEVPGNTLLGIMRLLVDKEFRKKIVDKVSNPIVKSFWVDEYANWNDRFRIEAIQPIQNKVGQFLSSTIIRNIVGQPKSTIDIRKFMDDEKILLMNLSKGKIGEDNSNLLGAMMVTKLQLAAMSRVDIAEKERADFFLYVDEMQNFVTESFADILSEARKYHLCLILSHQYIAQLSTKESTKVRDAIFGNVGTIVCFRVGAADAFFLLKEFEPYLTEEDLVSINNREIYLKLMIDGVNSKPFSATTMSPLANDRRNLKNMEKVIKVSRERYANPKAEVEEKIIRWLNMEETFRLQAESEKLAGDEVIFKAGVTTDKMYNKSNSGSTNFSGFKKNNISLGSSGDEKKSFVKDEKVLEAICDNCLKKTYLTFVPKAHLNVFCKDCLKKFKDGQIDTSKLELHNKHLSSNKINDLDKDFQKVSPMAPQEVSLNDLSKIKVEDKKPATVTAKDVPMGQRVKL